jgi:hypothetical protein
MNFYLHSQANYYATASVNQSLYIIYMFSSVDIFLLLVSLPSGLKDWSRAWYSHHGFNCGTKTTIVCFQVKSVQKCLERLNNCSVFKWHTMFSWRYRAQPLPSPLAYIIFWIRIYPWYWRISNTYPSFHYIIKCNRRSLLEFRIGIVDNQKI